MKKRLFLSLVCLLMGIGLTIAQNSTKITGVVVSEDDGEPVIGATVLIKGTTLGTITDVDGNFSFTNKKNTFRNEKMFFKTCLCSTAIAASRIMYKRGSDSRSYLRQKGAHN